MKEPILKEACSWAYPKSAICVQRFDDSLNSAIRITYRISLRSSSLREPRYPLLRVVQHYVYQFPSFDTPLSHGQGSHHPRMTLTYLTPVKVRSIREIG